MNNSSDKREFFFLFDPIFAVLSDLICTKSIIQPVAAAHFFDPRTEKKCSTLHNKKNVLKNKASLNVKAISESLPDLYTNFGR